MKKNTHNIIIEVALFLLSGSILWLAFSFLWQTPSEKYVGNSMVLWKGKMTRCGLSGDSGAIVDSQSLYCRGYAEGYQWGGDQANMFCKLDN